MNRVDAPVARVAFPRRAGFTLLELIVAMAIVAITAAALVASLRIALKARESSEQAAAGGRTSELVMEFLRDDLQCALPPRGTFATGFAGTHAQDDRGHDADDLVFFTTAPSPLHAEGANGEIKQIELTMRRLDNTSNDHVLVRRAWNNLLAPQQENPDEEVLCRHVDSLNIAYFDGNAWTDSWDSSTQSPASLPMAARVTLTLESGRLNPDGSPVLVRYTRIFQLPCYGGSSDDGTTSSEASVSSAGASGGSRGGT